MTPLLELAIGSSLLVLLGLAASVMLRHRSAAVRHAVLASSLYAAASVAPLSLLVPAWRPAAFTRSNTAASNVAVTAGAPRLAMAENTQRPIITAAQGVFFVWATGVAIGSLVLLTGLGRLRRIALHARPATESSWTRVLAELCAASGFQRSISLRHTDAPDLLATFGVIRPSVLLPAHARNWNEDRIRIVLAHELAHIRRHDWVVQISADVLRILCWFNPLFWAASTRLRRHSEQACDDVVLRGGVPPHIYAAHLLELARTCRRPGASSAAATPIASPSTLERRFAAMLNPALDRRPMPLRALVLTAAALVAVTLPIAAFSARQALPLPLTGSVYDTTGGVLPGVELTVENARQNTWRAVTDASGRFQFPVLEPGAYVLHASLAGFRALRHDFALRNTRDWDRAITLQVGELRETISVQEQRPAGAPTPAAAAGRPPIRVGGNIRIPRKVLDVRPVYPPAMRDAGREGVVPIDALIGRDGTVHSVRVLSANIHPDFAVAAAEAVRQWRFDPTLLNGVPVDVAMTVTVTFSLSD